MSGVAHRATPQATPGPASMIDHPSAAVVSTVDPDPVRATYRVIGAACPELAALTLPPDPDRGATLDGAVLLDRDWLADRVADTARRWNCPDARVAATLWWYSASAVLTGPGAAALLLTGTALDPRPARLRLALRTTGHVGYLRATRGTALLGPGPAAYGTALAEAFTPVVGLLAELGGVGVRSLWAIAADSLAGRLLAAAEASGVGLVAAEPSTARLAALGAQVAEATGGLLPPPRYGVAGTAPARRRYVRRGSCCLIYRVPDQPTKCLSCPRQHPAERNERLVAWAVAR